ncbi:major facilitator superfamily domain-containing protein [Syncephalastrum racemosum]|uniref:Major facilitator superfamily domain-containing protein n=1 Tax=Syncephalastrum racemosum TaxID=13706 RepID=A0A1X2HNK9_SYNRA|nr:major facilitator superfamily domain-containing protein [Syncephalastrum racemosum]
MLKRTTESLGLRPSTSGYGTLLTSDNDRGAHASMTPSSSMPSLAESSQTLQVIPHKGKDASETLVEPIMDCKYTDLGSISMNLLMLCMCVMTALPSIDGSILFIIQSTVASQFKSAHLVAWLHASYILGTCLTQPLAGCLADIYGRQPLLLLATTMFMVGSFICGAARSMVQLVMSRFLAGLGGGFVMTLTSIVVQDVVPRHLRGLYQSRLKMTQMGGIALGAPLGGFITDYFGWRNCFYINILPCLFVLMISFRLKNYTHVGKIQPNAIEKLKQIDFAGAILISTSTASLVTAMVMCGNLRPWTDPVIIGLLSICFASLAAFILHEWYLPEDSKCRALMPRRLISERNVLCSCFLNCFTAVENFAYLFLYPQFYMGARDITASTAGALTTTRVLGTITGAFIIGRYLRKHDYYNIMVLSAIGGVLTNIAIYFSSTMTMPIPVYMVPNTLDTFSLNGLLSVGSMISLTSYIPNTDNARAISMQFVFRGNGQVLGSTIAASIFQHALKTTLTKNIHTPNAPELVEFIRTSIAQIHTLPPELQKIAREAILTSFKQGLSVPMISAICCFLAAVFLRRK